jgi:SAM-dependent methyltransferase
VPHLIEFNHHGLARYWLDPVADTLAYYDQRADDFAAQTADFDLSSLYERFLRYIRPGGRILDAGCGVGRDAWAFAELGYEVVAFDASKEMVRLAHARLDNRANVHLMRFDDVSWRGEFDGIWACASLLHVPLASFPDAASRLAGALRAGGAWYMSFKLGKGERLAGGRLFVDHTEATLRSALSGLPVEIVGDWISTDLRPGRQAERWLNMVVVHR